MKKSEGLKIADKALDKVTLPNENKLYEIINDKSSLEDYLGDYISNDYRIKKEEIILCY